jgi:hypothetical protein
VRVRLRPRSPHGLTALVWLPDGVTEREAGLYSARSRTFATQGRGGVAGHGGMPTRQVPEVLLANHRNDVIVPDHAVTGAHETAISNPGISNPGISNPGLSNPGISIPAISSAALSNTGSSKTGASNAGPVAGATAATSDWFRSRPSASAAGNGNGSGGPGADSHPTVPPTVQQDGRGGSGSDGWATGRHAAQIVAEPVRGDFTSAGLPTRVPQANLIPGSVAGGRSAGANAPSRPGSGPAQAPITPRSPRSPDVARNRLSGFQRGVRRAKGLTPDDGEGADH